MRKIIFTLCLLGSAGIFTLLCFASSPYRLLRPYTLRGAKTLIPGSYRISKTGKQYQVLISFNENIKAPAFYIDQIPITIGEYRNWTRLSGYPDAHYRDTFEAIYTSPFHQHDPISFISWSEAEAFCEYYGGTLPTEYQWSTAAGIENDYLYAWGNSEPSPAKANYDGYYQGLIPAGWLPKGVSAFGVLDMSGNIREWILGVELPEYLRDAWKNKTPAQMLEYIEQRNKQESPRLLKGGGAQDFPEDLEIGEYQVHEPRSAGFNRGFRCVYPVE